MMVEERLLRVWGCAPLFSSRLQLWKGETL